jgi:hypothetical protein
VEGFRYFLLVYFFFYLTNLSQLQVSNYIYAEYYDMSMDSENLKKEVEDLFCRYPPEFSALEKKEIQKQ